VIGGCTPGAHGLDSTIVGYYKGRASCRWHECVVASRRQMFEQLRSPVTPDCPFAGLRDDKDALTVIKEYAGVA
jgi:hypothetical protein